MEINLSIILIAILILLLIIFIINIITISIIYKRTNDFYKISYKRTKAFKEFIIFIKEKFKAFEYIEKCINNTNKIVDNRVEEVHKHLYELEQKYFNDIFKKSSTKEK